MVRRRGKARGPIPDGLAVTGSGRGNSCASLPGIRSAQLASSASAGEFGRKRVEGEGGGREGGRQGTTSPFARKNWAILSVYS